MQVDSQNFEAKITKGRKWHVWKQLGGLEEGFPVATYMRMEGRVCIDVVCKICE